MKLLVLLSFAAIAANDFVASTPEPPKDSFGAPDKINAAEDTPATVAPPNPFHDFNNLYHGAFPPARFPHSNFLSSPTFPLTYPINTFNYAPLRQGILPPISQIIPPQISQIVPPISQIVPPLFPNSHPPLPLPSPVTPPNSFPPQLPPPAPKPLLPKFALPYAHPLTHFPATFSSFPSYLPPFPTTLPLAPTNFFPLPLQKQPPTTIKESLPTSYGPPPAAPETQEPEGPAENSAPFEPSSASYPYEPALPEEPEPAAPHKPAQEYGPPASN